MYKLFIALRYVRSRVVIILALLAVIVSVMAFVVIMAVLQGFGEGLREGIRRMNAHIDVRRRFFSAIDDHEQTAGEVRSVGGIRAILPYVGGPVVIQTSRYRAYRMVKGVKLAEEIKHTKIDDVLSTADLTPADPLVAKIYPGIILGKHFMEEVDLVEGHFVWLTAQGSEEARRLTFVVVGQADTGSNWFDQIFTLIDFEVAQKLFNCPKGASGLSVWVEDSSAENTVGVADRIDVQLNGEWDVQAARSAVLPEFESGIADAVAERLRRRTYRDSPSSIAREFADRLGADEERSQRLAEILADHLSTNFIVKPWFDQREDIFKAIKMQTVVMRVILVLYLLVMGVSIFVILWTIVAEKTRDIGLLRAIGARTGGVISIFLGTGLLIGLVGAAFGLAAGVALALKIDWVARFLGMGHVARDLFGMQGLPCRIELTDLVLVVVATAVMSLVASALPAWRASRVDPVESLRHE